MGGWTSGGAGCGRGGGSRRPPAVEDNRWPVATARECDASQRSFVPELLVVGEGRRIEEGEDVGGGSGSCSTEPRRTAAQG